jgi:non-canonical purine NTP pyrophosphatase (RdgB/HAM1 family)
MVRWFLVTVGPEGICAMIPAGAERGATARPAVAYCDGETLEVQTGETRGMSVARPQGEGGFGWDAIFRPEGASRTFAEMAPAEKDAFSMRRLALERLRPRLTPSGP